MTLCIPVLILRKLTIGLAIGITFPLSFNRHKHHAVSEATHKKRKEKILISQLY